MSAADKGDPTRFDYRRWVGQADTYDVLSGLQFAILFALGLRDTHKVVDIGCGSLRAGRLLIPYLHPRGYCGIDPFEQFIDEGLRAELGRDICDVKQPRFSHRDDFDLRDFGERFDFALAQSIYSHTHPELLVTALTHVREVLAPGGLLVGTWVPSRRTKFANVVAPRRDGGWEYPPGVVYSWDEFADHLGAAGLAGEVVPWRHPYQSWFVASADGAHRGSARRVRTALLEPSKVQTVVRDAKRATARLLRRR